ncbi:unnamed protein product, partial [Mesorhabditis spiculigera]
MTVPYMRQVATANTWAFIKLIFRWRGSVWKLVIWELIIWLYIYYLISFTYRFAIVHSQFEDVFIRTVRHIDALQTTYGTAVTFVLGFYVSEVAKRWWKVWMEIPWPDTVGLCIVAFYRDRKDAKGKAEDRMTRCTVVRYLVLSYVLVFRDINERIRKRFPTLVHLTPHLLTDEELKMILKEDPNLRCWMPFEWLFIIIKKAYEREQIDTEHHNLMVEKVLDFRQRLQNLQQFDYVNLPLVYSQVVNVSVYLYFCMALFAKQYLGRAGSPDDREVLYSVDYAIPFFAVVEFIIYCGWLKVAQVMLNPFGLDDDDFDIDMMVDRNLKVGLSMVDDYYDKCPPLVELKVTSLPHTLASAQDIQRCAPMQGSVAQVAVPKRLQKIVEPAVIHGYKMRDNSPPPTPEAELTQGSEYDKTEIDLLAHDEKKQSADKVEMSKATAISMGHAPAAAESVANTQVLHPTPAQSAGRRKSREPRAADKPERPPSRPPSRPNSRSEKHSILEKTQPMSGHGPSPKTTRADAPKPPKE